MFIKRIFLNITKTAQILYMLKEVISVLIAITDDSNHCFLHHLTYS